MMPNDTATSLGRHGPIVGILQGSRRILRMGGQACVFYGVAEFSRDTDIVIALSPTNLRRLRFATSG